MSFFRSLAQARARWVSARARRLDPHVYQERLDLLVAAGRVEDACTLMDEHGPTDEVLVLPDADLSSLVFAGTVVCQGSLLVGKTVRVGGGVFTDGGLSVGRALIAGGRVDVGGAAYFGSGAEGGEDIRVARGLVTRGFIRCRRHLNVGWELKVAGELSVGGDAVLGDHASVAGALEVAGRLEVAGDLWCGGHLGTDHVVVRGSAQVIGGLRSGTIQTRD
jgi:predicted acyltransferase (DUF342 family)